MKVILLKSIPKLGKKDDIVEVSEGYAANALFPKRFAVVATQAAIDALHTRQNQKVAEKTIQANLLDKFIETLLETPLEIKAKMNAKGGLFSGIDEKDISKELLAQHNIELDPKMIVVEGGVIRQSGTINVSIKGHTGTFIVNVIGVK